MRPFAAIPAAPKVVPDAAAPQWAHDLAAAEPRHFTLISVRVPSAQSMDGPALQKATLDAYHTIASRLRVAATTHPVRFWNYVPDITRPLPDGRNRYMAFNAGRFLAFSNWYGSPSDFDRHVATASAVGAPGADLVVHCLAASRPGTPVANPRQIQPFNYSRRFGPLPPCFARATRITAGRTPLLLVGGTASIRGEDTLHAADLAAQTRETFANLAALLGAAVSPEPFAGGEHSLLRHFRHLRVYHPRPTDADAIRTAIARSFPDLRHVELVGTDLCRPDLLVEIEGLAELSAR